MINFKRHQKEQHNPYKVKCDICLKDFTAERFLKFHKKNAHAAEPKWHVCQICNAHYKWDASLLKHMRIKHPEYKKYSRLDNPK